MFCVIRVERTLTGVGMRRFSVFGLMFAMLACFSRIWRTARKPKNPLMRSMIAGWRC